jgi:threonine aldolase
MQHFVSDNNAGMCPQAVAAMLEANAGGHAVGYGDDRWSVAARAKIRGIFETDCAVFFVFSGTGANALSLAHLTRSYHAVIAHRHSHVAEDETGAPEFFSGGAKVLGVDTPLGKVTPEAVDQQCEIIGRIHTSRPRVVSLTQATEMGTIYQPGEVAAVAETARGFGLKVHMDGARFANAVVRLNASPADITWRAGVDVLSFGGTKNGLGSGEAVVFFDHVLAEEFSWRIKQSGQLNSKMRLMSAPWIGLLGDEVWLKNARHANAMADRLAAGLAGLPGLRLMFPVEANGVFVDMAQPLQAAVRAKGWQFITFLGETGCRLMCAWDTEPATVDRFIDDVAAAVRDGGASS